jgi:hypothetical protein
MLDGGIPGAPMTLRLEMTADDLRHLRRTARGKPSGSFNDNARAVIANAVVHANGTATSQLTSWRHVERCVRLMWSGEGGFQNELRKLGATLVLDGGRELTDAVAIASAVFERERLLAGLQMSLFTMTVATSFAA